MKPVPIIHPNAVFDKKALGELLFLKDSTIGREVRLGRLRVSRRAGRYYFLGAWILQWLRAGEVCRPPAKAKEVSL
jgi:hypothetical protein